MRYLKGRFMGSKISALLQMVEYTEPHIMLIRFIFQFGTTVTLLDTKLVLDMKPDYIPLSLLSTIEYDTNYLVGNFIFNIYLRLFVFLLSYYHFFEINFACYYVDILGVLVGVGTESELQVDGNKTKLNVIAIEANG